VPGLGLQDVDGYVNPTSAALDGVGPIPLVRKKMLHRRQQKRAEPAPLSISVLNVPFFEQACEEPLRQIEGLIPRIAAPPDERIDRIPVYLTERCQCVAGFRRRVAGRREDQAPGRGLKLRHRLATSLKQTSVFVTRRDKSGTSLLYPIRGVA